MMIMPTLRRMAAVRVGLMLVPVLSSCQGGGPSLREELDAYAALQRRVLDSQPFRNDQTLEGYAEVIRVMVYPSFHGDKRLNLYFGGRDGVRIAVREALRSIWYAHREGVPESQMETTEFQQDCVDEVVTNAVHVLRRALRQYDTARRAGLDGIDYTLEHFKPGVSYARIEIWDPLPETEGGFIERLVYLLYLYARTSARAGPDPGNWGAYLRSPAKTKTWAVELDSLERVREQLCQATR